MYGRECIGVSVDSIYTDDEEEPLPSGWRHDSLGKGYIVYWPNMKWDDSWPST